MLLPMVAGMMTASIGSGQIISRIGRYKIFMQVGIVIATAMIALLTLLTPETPYWHEAIIMAFVGFGLGLVMPVMNLAIQNEFEQKDLGVATSSVQLFRGLGSTIGIAIFGAMLTNGLTANLTNVQNEPFIQQLSKNPAVAKQLGDLDDPNTLLNLNTPDIKHKVREQAHAGIDKLPLPDAVKAEQVKTFDRNQDAYSYKITHAFSKSLRGIFIASAVLMAGAAVVVFMVKERELKSASPEATPGEM